MNCLTCGACCSIWSIDVTSEDNVPEQLYHTVKFFKNLNIVKQQMKLREDKSCFALEGKVGEKVNCTIYESRPKVCKKFEIGSKECLLAREKFNINN